MAGCRRRGSRRRGVSGGAAGEVAIVPARLPVISGSRAGPWGLPLPSAGLSGCSNAPPLSFRPGGGDGAQVFRALASTRKPSAFLRSEALQRTLFVRGFKSTICFLQTVTNVMTERPQDLGGLIQEKVVLMGRCFCELASRLFTSRGSVLLGASRYGDVWVGLGSDTCHFLAFRCPGLGHQATVKSGRGWSHSLVSVLEKRR